MPGLRLQRVRRARPGRRARPSESPAGGTTLGARTAARPASRVKGSSSSGPALEDVAGIRHRGPLVRREEPAERGACAVDASSRAGVARGWPARASHRRRAVGAPRRRRTPAIARDGHGRAVDALRQSRAAGRSGARPPRSSAAEPPRPSACRSAASRPARPMAKPLPASPSSEPQPSTLARRRRAAPTHHRSRAGRDHRAVARRRARRAARSARRSRWRARSHGRAPPAQQLAAPAAGPLRPRPRSPERPTPTAGAGRAAGRGRPPPRAGRAATSSGPDASRPCEGRPGARRSMGRAHP